MNTIGTWTFNLDFSKFVVSHHNIGWYYSISTWYRDSTTGDWVKDRTAPLVTAETETEIREKLLSMISFN